MEEVLTEHTPRVLVLDVAFRWADPELISRLVREHPSCAIMVYVHHSVEECALRQCLLEGGRSYLSREAIEHLDECCLTSLREQARGCLTAESDPDTILRSICSVASGEVAAAPWLTAVGRAGGSVLGGRGNGGGITARELDVVALLAEGLSNKQIAKRLGIREQTVKNHVHSLMEKLDTGSRLETGLMAQRLHLRADEGSRHD